MSLKDAGVDPTSVLCSSADMKVGRDVMSVVAGIQLREKVWSRIHNLNLPRSRGMHTVLGKWLC